MKKLTRSGLKAFKGGDGPKKPDFGIGYCPNDCDKIENFCLGGKSCRGYTIGAVDGVAQCAICE